MHFSLQHNINVRLLSLYCKYKIYCLLENNAHYQNQKIMHIINRISTLKLYYKQTPFLQCCFSFIFSRAEKCMCFQQFTSILQCRNTVMRCLLLAVKFHTFSLWCHDPGSLCSPGLQYCTNILRNCSQYIITGDNRRYCLQKCMKWKCSQSE